MFCAALAGCDSGEAPGVGAAPADSAPSVSAEGRGGSTVLRPVAWPSPGAVDGQALRALSPTARAVVARAPVPVLVPASTALLERAILMSKRVWFALSTSHDGLTVALRASRLAHRHVGVPPQRGDRRVRGQPAYISRERRVLDASWMEYGVAYTLSVECSDAADPRCADETWMLQLADGLAFVGGSRQGEPQALGEDSP